MGSLLLSLRLDIPRAIARCGNSSLELSTRRGSLRFHQGVDRHRGRSQHSRLYITRVLDRAIAFRVVHARSAPITSRIHRTRAGPVGLSHGVELTLIAPGKPTQKAFVESFNGRFRDECLNDHWFENLTVAGALIAAWRLDYNECRPHSALRYLTPAEFARRPSSSHAAPESTSIPLGQHGLFAYLAKKSESDNPIRIASQKNPAAAKSFNT